MRARWAALLLGVACSSSNPGGGGGGGSGVTGVTVAAPSKATSGLRFPLQATVQGTASNKDVIWTVEGGGTLGDASSNPATYTAPMVTAITTVRVKATSVADSTKSATQSIEVDPAPPLVAQVNPGVVPSQPSLPDRQGNPLPLGNSSDERGIQTEFIVGQVRVRPRNASDLPAFLQRYDGTVVADDTIPQRPAALGPPLTAEQRAPKEFTVRINLAKVDPSTFPADAAAVGLSGTLDFSSTDALLSMAAATNALAQGFSAAPNFVEHPHGFPRTLLSTQERPIPAGGFEDALTKSKRFGTTDSQSNVTLAWQFVAAHGIARRVFVVILDGGFWLNADGTARGTDSDWPAKPIQYDIQGDDDFADGPSPSKCTGGTSCFWHGTGSAGTATGTLDNQAGAAGTGGLVADPVLFKFSGARDQRNRGVRTAVAWGADVLSMSFGGDCNKGCRIYDRDNAVFDDAIDSGSKIVFVSSAGNDGNDVGDPHFYHPCIEDHTICVGALDDDKTTKIDYSNYGGQVDIFAPTNIPVMLRPAGNDNDPAGTPVDVPHGGTSASAPFVAGVVAMMKAINPALDNDTVANILHNTAHHGAAPVDSYIDAYAAVRAVAAGIPGVTDRLEPNNTASAAVGVSSTVGPITLLSFHTDTDHDFFQLNFSEPSRVTLNFSYAQALGALHVGEGYGLEADHLGCGEFAEESTTLGTDSQTLIYRVPAGSYLVEVSGKLNAYDWSFTKSTTLAPFVTPDGFEPNNLRSLAKDVGYGLHGTATLTSGDVDYFRVTSMGTIDNPYLHSETGFYVSRTDVPIVVEVTDVHGIPLGAPAVGGTDCQGVVGIGAFPAGTYYVKVSARTAGQTGTYSFYGGVSAKGGTGPVHDRVYDRIHPGDPVEGLIVNRYKGYIFTLAPQVSQLGLVSQSLLHFQLLDVQGNVLTEGISENTQGQGYFERMSLANLSVGTDYLVQVNRVNAQLDSPPGTVPPASFTMGWASPAAPTRDSGNLILNGDADDGNQQASDDGSVVPLRFWVSPAGSNLTVVYYNSLGFPTFDDPIPPSHGFHFFAGGPANASSSANQTIDLAGNYASWFPAIDAGRATFNLSGWFGGYLDQDDGSALTVTFVDASEQPLGTVTLGPVLAGERDNLTALLLRQTDGNLPPGTRLITLHLEMTRAGGAYNDGVADTLQLNLLDWTP